MFFPIFWEFFLLRCEVKGRGCRMCTDCKALWGKFVICVVFNWIEEMKKEKKKIVFTDRSYSGSIMGPSMVPHLLNSIPLILYISSIINYKFASEGFTICTHTTSLTFDLTSDQEKLPRNREKKTFTRKKSKERGDPSPGRTEQSMSCGLKSYTTTQTLNSPPRNVCRRLSSH